MYVKKRVSIYKKKADGSFSSTAINLNDAYGIEIRKGLGNIKDSFTFKIYMPKNNVMETYYSGDGTTTDFTLTFQISESEFYSFTNRKVSVTVSDVEKQEGYEIEDSGQTLSFTAGNAPASGSDNIKVSFPVVESGDLCRIYIWKDKASPDDSDCLFEGIIDNAQVEISPNRTKLLTVNGKGAIDIIFSAPVFIKDTSLTKPEEIIQTAITQINNYNTQTERQIYGKNSTEWGNLSNSTTSTDIQFTASYMSAIEIIEAVSQDKYTKDGAYYYYVKYDATNDRYNFYWKSKTSTTTASEIEEGTYNLKVNKDNSEVINAIIFNVGLDCYEVPQEFPNFADTSIVGHGVKWRYVIETNFIISDLLNQEFEADTSEWDTGADGNRISNFPTDTSSWTFQFETRNDDGTYTGTDATATDDETFNDAIVKEAMWRGIEMTDRILEMFQNGRIKAEASGAFNTTFSLGDLVPVTSDSYNLDEYPLRVEEIKYTEFETVYYLIEDETAAIERLIS